MEEKTAADGGLSAGSQDYPVFLALLLIVVFTVVVFRGVGGNTYVYDDKINVVSNAHLAPLSWENLTWFWTTPYANLYVPVTYSVLALEAKLAAKTDETSGRVTLDASVFHYGNLAFHVANAALVLLLLRSVVGHTLPAMAGALLFALHPLQAETVNWITETKGLLATLFGVLAVWQYWLFAAGNRHVLSSTPCGVTISPSPSLRWLHYAVATIAFGLALLSKPSAVAVPLVALVLDAGLLRRGFVATIVPTAAWFCLGLVTVVVTRGEQTLANFQYVTPLIDRPLVAIDALAFYLEKLSVPGWLCIDYGRQPSYVLGQGWRYAAWLVPLLFVGLLLLLPDRRKWLVFAAVFVAGLFPMLGFVPFGFQDISTVADRYAYFAMLGPALALAWTVERYDRRAVIVAVAVALLVLGSLSHLQTRYWHNSRSLFEHVLTVNQRSVTANLVLGNLVSGSNPTDAARYFRAAVEIAPNHAGANGSLGTMLFVMGELREAIQHLRTSIETKPDNYLAHFYLAQALASRADYAEAQTHYEQTLQHNPRFTTATIQLAWLLATCPDDAVRDGERAIELLSPIVKEQENADPLAIDSLAAANADVGKFDVAAQAMWNLIQRLRIVAKHDPRWLTYLRAIEQRVQLYQARQPYRGGPTHQLVPSRITITR